MAMEGCWRQELSSFIGRAYLHLNVYRNYFSMTNEKFFSFKSDCLYSYTIGENTLVYAILGTDFSTYVVGYYCNKNSRFGISIIYKINFYLKNY